MALVLSVGALAAGCGGGDGERSTAPTPPDRLAVSLREAGTGGFRVDLECAVVDRGACAEVLRAIGGLDDDETCAPADGGDARVEVAGTIDGVPVRAVIRRRTDCEVRAYDGVVSAVGLGPDAAQPARTRAAAASPDTTASASASSVAS